MHWPGFRSRSQYAMRSLVDGLVLLLTVLHSGRMARWWVSIRRL